METDYVNMCHKDFSSFIRLRRKFNKLFDLFSGGLNFYGKFSIF